MDKQEVLNRIAAHRDRLDQFAVQSLFLFGSVARGEATPTSDVDFLVEFTHPVGLFTLLSLQTFLEDLLGCPVDLGIPNLTAALSQRHRTSGGHPCPLEISASACRIC